MGAFLSLTVGFLVILMWTKRHFGLLVIHTHTQTQIYIK